MESSSDKDAQGDVAVIRKILDGSVDEFGLLVTKYKAKISAIAAGRVKSEDVESVAHQTFLRAFKSLDTYAGKAPFENWLSRLAVHCCHDYWRERRRETAKFADPGTGTNCQVWLERASSARSEKDWSAAAEMSETKQFLENAMAALDGDERWLIESHYYAGIALKDAAATLGWSLVKTKVRAMRARHKLRKAMEGMLK